MASIWILLSLAFLCVVLKALTIGRREKGLPPGPPTLPVLGNIHMMPSEYMFLQFTQWSRQYGGLLSLKLASGTILSVGTASAVKQVFDQQGATTSSRPHSHMADLTSKGAYFVFVPSSSDIFKKGRRAINLFTTNKNLEQHWPHQRAEGVQLLHDLMHTPSDLYSHIQRASISAMTSLLFGKRCPSQSDSTIQQFIEYIELWNAILDPTAHPPVDLLPILKWIPERWAPWKRMCRKAKSLREEMILPLMQDCQERLDAGKSTDSWMEKVLQNQQGINMDKNMILQLASAFMDAGSETTSAYLRTLIVILIEFPEHQKRAQQEIDEFIGSDRMPALEDLPSMPFVNALMQETLRYRPVIPMVPHAAAQDEVLMGHYIPKDAPLVLNIYSVLHEHELFEDADEFKPERYLGSHTGIRPGVDASDFRDTIAFGAGRRMCPGENMAKRSTALNTMNMLWAFNFTDNGHFSKKKLPPSDFSNYCKMGLELAPLPYTCNVTLRNAERGDIIENSFNALC